jgi:hypothetical protein
LAVKDIQASKLFYEKLGFTAFAGDQSQNWLIMKNGDRYVGLFQGMFDKNILTFNPGLDERCPAALRSRVSFSREENERGLGDDYGKNNRNRRRIL